MKANSLLIICFISLIFFSCKKEKTDYINHESEIFQGKDTLIYGDWNYLYTWKTGGYSGLPTKEFKNLPFIKFDPLDKYEKRMLGETIENGKIDTVGHLGTSLLVIFFPNGIRIDDPYLTSFPYNIYVRNNDTLVIGLKIGTYNFIYTTDYYKRIK